MLLEQGSCVFENQVSTVVTVGVIDLFKEIDISNSQTEMPFLFFVFFHKLLQLAVAGTAVVQFGQGILLQHGAQGILHDDGGTPNISQLIVSGGDRRLQLCRQIAGRHIGKKVANPVKYGNQILGVEKLKERYNQHRGKGS